MTEAPALQHASEYIKAIAKVIDNMINSDYRNYGSLSTFLNGQFFPEEYWIPQMEFLLWQL